MSCRIHESDGKLKKTRWTAPGFLNPGFSMEFDESIAMVRRLSSMARKLFTEVLASNAQFAAFESYCWPSRRWFSMALGSFSALNHTVLVRVEQLRIARSCTVWEHFPNHLNWYEVFRNNRGFCQTTSDTFGLPCTSLECFATFPGVVEGLQNLGYPGDAARETGTGW